MSTKNRHQRGMIRFAVVLLTALAIICSGYANSHADASAPTAKGQVNASKGVYLRAKASTSAKKVVKVKNNAKLTIIKEVYLKKNNNSTKYKWYYVKSASGKKGYIQASKVDTVKYSAVDGVTTDDLNYRVGPDTNMERVGTLKDNSSLKVVLPANVKGKKTVWYKIKKGSKYYYVCSTWAELEEPKTTAAAAAKPVTPAKPATPATPAKPDPTPTFELKDVTYPGTMLEKMPFVLKGKITCSQNITSVKFGVVNAAGKWVITKEAAVGANEFNIADIDSSIKFGTLEPGKYVYTGILKVNGKEYKKINKEFTVKKSTSSQKLAAVAQQLAWPYGTEKEVYGSKPTDAYAAALDKVYPKHDTWGKGPNTGASCDVFIGTICRYSGVDTGVPRTLKEIWKYFEGNPDTWVRVPYTGDESQLQSGDIFIIDPNTSSRHICMYLKIDGKAYCAEASYPRALYGFINKSTTKFFSTSKKDVFVYRPIS